MKLLSQDQFFNDVAAASGYVDPNTVKLVYNGMLAIIYRELRDKGAIRLPALCDFHMRLAKGRTIRNHNMKEAIYKPAHHQIRIRTLPTVRKYFKMLDEQNPGVDFDPAERIKKDPTIIPRRKKAPTTLW